MDWAIFAIMLWVALISSTLTRWSMRGGIELDYTPIRSIASVFGFVAVIAGIIWGFMNIPWYFVIGIFIGENLAMPRILNPRNDSFEFFARVKPVLDFITIGCSAALWIVF